MLLPCRVLVLRPTVSKAWRFARFLRMLLSSCVHVAFRNVSKAWRFPTGVFPGFGARCFHYASMLLTKTVDEPGVFRGFGACGFHVASMLLSKTFEEPCVFPVLALVAFMSRPCCVPKGCKNLVLP